MAGVLLDTHALLWLAMGNNPLSDQALLAIGESQATGRLLVSPISSWELAIAALKPVEATRPDLGAMTASRWFAAAISEIGARVAPISQKIAIEAAFIASTTQHRDPGDCFLVATARVRRVPLITRDKQLLGLARAGHLTAIPC